MMYICACKNRLLVQLVGEHGLRKWSHIAENLPGRIGKQCRERWHNHLKPDIKVNSSLSYYNITYIYFYHLA